MARLLVEELGCSVDARGWIQATPLHLASRGNRLEAVTVLISNGMVGGVHNVHDFLSTSSTHHGMLLQVPTPMHGTTTAAPPWTWRVPSVSAASSPTPRKFGSDLAPPATGN